MTFFILQNLKIQKNPRSRRPPYCIFRLCEFDHSGVLIV